MAKGEAELDAWVAKLRRLPEMVKAAAPELAVALKSELDKNIAAGRAPDGSTWKPKKDGGRPLVNAAAAVTTRADGSVVQAVLTGPEVFHHYGTKKDPERQILPRGVMPDSLGLAFRAKMVEQFEKTMGGGR
jgi:hypothetical protein